MPLNRGKQFEYKFKKDFEKLEDVSIDRIYDSVSGYKAISNICDFIAYKCPNIFYFECKSIKGNTFPLTNLKQYDKLIVKKGIKGVRVGVILWFIEHQKVLYIPIKTFKKLKEDGKKSFNIKMVEDKTYECVEIPSQIKKVFLDSDYSVLFNLDEGW